MKLKRKNRKGESGQAAIEFIVVVIVIFFFLFFLLSLSMAMVVSDYVEYATFMAARTYKSGYSSRGAQERFARRVFTAYTERIDPVARNFQLRFVNVGEGSDLTAGVLTTYELDLFYLPPLFITGDDVPVSRITLRSEAVLGRDPAFEDCTNFFRNFNNRFGLGITDAVSLEQMADNGC